MTDTKTNQPLMYNGWLIRKVKTPFQGTKLAAYNFRTDVYINPLYNTWDQLKSVIDGLEDSQKNTVQ
jgi:hypothetical protein